LYSYDNFRLEDSPTLWPGIDGKIARHVVWLRSQKDGWHSFFSDVLKITEYCTVKVLLRGTPVDQGYKRYIRSLEKYSEFMRDKDHFQPPPFATVEEKSKERTFTHVHYFAIHEKRLWSKARYDERAQWQPIYFDNETEEEYPEVICGDGCNLIVLDNRKKVHYKKALRETLDDGVYKFVDKVIKDNWKPTWFSLPYISNVINLFTPKRLLIDSRIKSWTVSNLGRFARYYEDGAGAKHDVKTCTTLFALFHGSRDIYTADPWLPNGFNYPADFIGLGFNHSISGPENLDFTYDDIDAAGSTIVLSGFENGLPAFYTTMADFDILGRNPLYKYTDEPSEVRPNEVRLTTPVNWKKEPDLPLDYQATGRAFIFQSGEGNENRTLRVPVRHANGEVGFLQKQIKDQEWHLLLLHSMPSK
jgi:hypothetical protein